MISQSPRTAVCGNNNFQHPSPGIMARNFLIWHSTVSHFHDTVPSTYFNFLFPPGKLQARSLSTLLKPHPIQVTRGKGYIWPSTLLLLDLLVNKPENSYSLHILKLELDHNNTWSLKQKKNIPYDLINLEVSARKDFTNFNKDRANKLNWFLKSYEIAPTLGQNSRENKNSWNSESTQVTWPSRVRNRGRPRHGSSLSNSVRAFPSARNGPVPEVLAGKYAMFYVLASTSVTVAIQKWRGLIKVLKFRSPLVHTLLMMSPQKYVDGGSYLIRVLYPKKKCHEISELQTSPTIHLTEKLWT